MSEISRMYDDSQMAADMIERALYALQNSFHPSFQFAKSQNGICYLNYSRVENRGLFIALFKHILYISSKACYRTSLELSKLLLSLDCDGDPLAIILLIDLYAIRSSQYNYLIDFYESFDEFKHLSLLPNMLMSTALAYHYLSKQPGQQQKQAYAAKANAMLREALLKFPNILLELLDKCGVVADRDTEKSRIFSKVANLNVSVGLKHLCDLYVLRMHNEWKLPENVQWLDSIIREVLADESSLESQVKAHKKK